MNGEHTDGIREPAAIHRYSYLACRGYLARISSATTSFCSTSSTSSIESKCSTLGASPADKVPPRSYDGSAAILRGAPDRTRTGTTARLSDFCTPSTSTAGASAVRGLQQAFILNPCALSTLPKTWLGCGAALCSSYFSLSPPIPATKCCGIPACKSKKAPSFVMAIFR